MFQLAKIIRVLFCALLAIIPSGHCHDQYFSWFDCGGSLVHFNQLGVNPKPLVFAETSEIILTSDIEINQQLPIEAIVSLELNKTIKLDNELLNITIPCLEQYFGSCTFPICKLITSWYKDLICPVLLHCGKECRCPINNGHYSFENFVVKVPFDKFHGILAQIASGDYVAKFTIDEAATNNQLACLHINARIVDKK